MCYTPPVFVCVCVCVGGGGANIHSLNLVPTRAVRGGGGAAAGMRSQVEGWRCFFYLSRMNSSVQEFLFSVKNFQEFSDLLSWWSWRRQQPRNSQRMQPVPFSWIIIRRSHPVLIKLRYLTVLCRSNFDRVANKKSIKHFFISSLCYCIQTTCCKPNFFTQWLQAVRLVVDWHEGGGLVFIIFHFSPSLPPGCSQTRRYPTNFLFPPWLVCTLIA